MQLHNDCDGVSCVACMADENRQDDGELRDIGLIVLQASLALSAARAELVCPECGNGKSAFEGGERIECPVCHGEHMNRELVAQIERALDDLDKIGGGA